MEQFEIVWQADPVTAARTRTAQFMRANTIDSFDDLVTRSATDPEWF